MKLGSMGAKGIIRVFVSASCSYKIISCQQRNQCDLHLMLIKEEKPSEEKSSVLSRANSALCEVCHHSFSPRAINSYYIILPSDSLYPYLLLVPHLEWW